MVQLFDFNEIEPEIFLEMNHPNNSPFQSYGWLKILHRAYLSNILQKSCLLYKIVILKEKDKIMAIAPIVLNRFGSKKDSIMCWGYNMQTDYTDFIYNKDISKGQINQLIDGIIELTGKNEIWLSSLPEESITYEAIKNRNSHALLDRHVCVSIPLNEISYEEWFRGLSKSVRQNIRTAHNRIANDKRNGELVIYDGTKSILTTEMANKTQLMYERRRRDLNSENKSLKYKLRCLYRAYSLKCFSYMAQAMLSNDNSETIIYYIDSNIAAFGHSLIRSSTGSPTFMQVAYNEDYKRYSPGMLMFEEYIKNKNSREKAIAYCDLALGSEKYKYDLGGDDHYTVSIKVK